MEKNKTKSMRGQWIGTSTGTNTGTVIANFDELPSHYQGSAYLLDDNGLVPSSATFFNTEDKNGNFNFRANINPIDPITGVFARWENIKHHFQPGVQIPDYADVTGSWSNDLMNLSWKTPIGTNGTVVLRRSMADKPSELVPFEQNWAAYKNYAAGLVGRRYLFRGQSFPWRLRTAFHRTGRADLKRFLEEDIPLLHKHLSARTKHVYNLQNPEENGAFYNLIQHHGYPTPLLDWTYSPYVAAFFAYRGISNEDAADAGPNEKVRIHIFDQAQWKTDWRQLYMVLAASPHVSIGEYMAIENERLIPQQAASTVTNLDDIESYIKAKESTNRKKYLWAIDMPVRDRKSVVQELNFMGITAGSLFPGLDGACEELKERNFTIAF
jgi:hypothetical protein